MLTNFSAEKQNETIIEKIVFFRKSSALSKIQHLFLLNFHFPIYFPTFFVKKKRINREWILRDFTKNTGTREITRSINMAVFILSPFNIHEI